ncbi:MAG: lipoate--protein ligase [Coriobacteriia bacterium]|nr:lipoate--protein ligase [Coriobacteriia bacterium]MCL2536983.1 lipoate--protein ligase [Coriobacteriia bacterium]
MRFIEHQSLDAAYFFAIEDYIVHNKALEDPVIMLWQTKPTIMLGQYQIAEAEVDMPRALDAGVELVRRPSGGGTIFTDEGTVLLSLLLPQRLIPSGFDKFPQKRARAEFVDILCSALNQMGVPAKPEGRNDIVVDGRKISGMAQHVHQGRSCTHGSLLFDADIELLSTLLRVDEEKFRTKAVKSVQGRVVNIKEFAAAAGNEELSTLDTASFVAQLKEVLYQATDAKEYQLTEDDIAQVDAIYAEKYGNPEWARRHTPHFTIHATKRFPAGKLDVFVDVFKGAVKACSIHGDFMGSAPMGDLELQFVGLNFGRDEFREVLDAMNLSPYLGELKASEFLSCIFE